MCKIFKCFYLRIRKRATFSEFSSMARCNRVCRHSSGPSLQESVSTPYLLRISDLIQFQLNLLITKQNTYLTRVEAMSSWLEVRASHSIGSPFDDGTAISTPRLHNSSTTIF